MNNKISKTLEFEKIKQQLQNFAATDQGIDKIQALRPEIDQEKVVALQNETEDGRKVLRLKGGNSDAKAKIHPQPSEAS